jgi:hypothetical protein
MPITEAFMQARPRLRRFTQTLVDSCDVLTLPVFQLDVNMGIVSQIAGAG